MANRISRRTLTVATVGALAVTGLLASSTGNVPSQASAQAGATADVSKSLAKINRQLVINQRISSAAVRRSNEALRRLEVLETEGGDTDTRTQPVDSLSTYKTYVERLNGGQVVTLAQNGPLRVFARCRENQSGADSIGLYVVSLTADAYISGEDDPLVAYEPVQIGEVTGPAGATAFGQLVDGSAAYARLSGTDHYLAVNAETVALGVNVLGAKCVVAGSSFQATKAP
jgi:hypothetical protein